MKNKKGFTLVEVLAVIVILGILVTTIIGSVSVYIKNGKDAYNSDLDDQSILTSKNYFVDNPEDLSKGYITFKELASKGYLSKDVIDAYGNNCMENSYVTVEKIEEAKSLTLNNIKYHACIKCDNDGYTNIKENSNCNVNIRENEPTKPDPEKTKTLTINVVVGTINNKTTESYSIKNNETSYKDISIKPNENSVYKSATCNNSATVTYATDSNKLSVSNITKDTTCTVAFEPKVTGTPVIILSVINENSNVTLGSENNQKTAIGGTATFNVEVPAPSDRYVISKDITCDKDGVTTNTTDNWKREINNNTRKDTFTVQNNSVGDDTAISCTVTYKPRWVGVEKQTYDEGNTITYAGKQWTVVSDKENSVKLALNGIAEDSKNLPYSSASKWFDETWLRNQPLDLKTDRNNQGLLPLSSGVYFNTDSGISTNYTGANYYVSSTKFYNSAKRTHYKLTKQAFVNEAYKKNDTFTNTIYNTGYSTDYTTAIGIKTFTDGKYYINSSNKLVFKSAGTPTYTSLSGHHTSRFMTYKMKKSISSSPCAECKCTSGKESICYIRDKNYRTATISSDGKVSYVATALEDGYGYIGDGNKAIFDTEKLKFYLCGGGYHGKLLTFEANNTSKYTWTSPKDNSYNPSYDNNDVFKIAGNDITYCPRSGKTSEYNGCTPKKTGVPHTRTYKANKTSACKSNLKKYTLQNKEVNIYYRPQLEVRKR